MFNEYLEFFYKGLLNKNLNIINNYMGEENEIHSINVGSDENGVFIESSFNENTPEELKVLFDEVQDKLAELKEDGVLDTLDENDVEEILTKIFIRVLGEADEIISQTIGDEIFDRKTWFLSHGTVSRIMKRKISKDDGEDLKEDTIAYHKFKLQEAIDQEDYQAAAFHRDKIKTFK